MKQTQNKMSYYDGYFPETTISTYSNPEPTVSTYPDETYDSGEDSDFILESFQIEQVLPRTVYRRRPRGNAIQIEDEGPSDDEIRNVCEKLWGMCFLFLVMMFIHRSISGPMVFDYEI